MLLQSMSRQASVATAGMWMMVLEEPPIAIQTRMALVMADSVMISRGQMFFSHSSITFRPASRLRLMSSPDTAAMVALPGRDMPMVSVSRLMVLAVPIMPQAPLHGAQV